MVQPKHQTPQEGSVAKPEKLLQIIYISKIYAICRILYISISIYISIYKRYLYVYIISYLFVKNKIFKCQMFTGNSIHYWLTGGSSWQIFEAEYVSPQGMISTANLRIQSECSDLSYQAQTFCTPDSIVHRVNMGPTWVLSAPDGPHVGPMNLAIKDDFEYWRWCYRYLFVKSTRSSWSPYDPCILTAIATSGSTASPPSSSSWKQVPSSV